MGCFYSKNKPKPKFIVTHDNSTNSIKISEKEIVCQKETAEMDEVSRLSSDSNTVGHIEDEKDMFPFPEKDYGSDRLALQHHLFKYVWQSNFSAPVDDKLNSGAKVLDFGCGTLTWLIDLSSQYPNSKFFGVDQPYLLRVGSPTIPSNVVVQYYDIISDLPFENETFDFIYMRFMAGELPEKQTERIINELMRVLKVGGYLEIMDIDAQGRNEGPLTQEFVSSVKSFYNAMGRNPLMVPEIESYLRSIKNLTSITVEQQFNPVGNWDNDFSWGKSIGEIAQINWTMFLNQMKFNLIPFLGVSDRKYKEMISKFEEEVNIFQTYWNSSRIYGKKVR